jgi:hypothetical protein
MVRSFEKYTCSSSSRAACKFHICVLQSKLEVGTFFTDTFETDWPVGSEPVLSYVDWVTNPSNPDYIPGQLEDSDYDEHSKVCNALSLFECSEENRAACKFHICILQMNKGVGTAFTDTFDRDWPVDGEPVMSYVSWASDPSNSNFALWQLEYEDYEQYYAPCAALSGMEMSMWR